MTAQHAIVVLGMHRSGTSAVAGVLRGLGVDFGSRLTPGDAHNPTGYWEHTERVDIHDRLLRSLESSWHDVCPLPKRWWESDRVAAFGQQIGDVVRRDFRHAPLWAIKDPRLCRLLPLWRRIFVQLGIRASFVIVTRSPTEVAASLRQRNGLDPTESSLLWLRHNLAAERDTRDSPRVFLTYELLLADWRTCAERIRRTVALPWPRPLAAVESEIDEFVSGDLRHHRDRPGGDAVATPLVRWLDDAARALGAAAHGDESGLTATLTTIDEDLDKVSAIFCPAVQRGRRELGALLEDANIDRLAVRAALGRSQEYAVSLRAHLAQLRELRLPAGPFSRGRRLLARLRGRLPKTDAPLPHADTEDKEA